MYFKIILRISSINTIFNVVDVLDKFNKVTVQIIYFGSEKSPQMAQTGLELKETNGPNWTGTGGEWEPSHVQ